MSTRAQFMRRCEKIFSGLLCRRREQYAGNRFGNEPSGKAVLEDRIRQLEQLVDRLTLENGFLIVAVQRGLLSAKERVGSLLNIVTCLKPLKGGDNS